MKHLWAFCKAVPFSGTRGREQQKSHRQRRKDELPGESKSRLLLSKLSFINHLNTSDWYKADGEVWEDYMCSVICNVVRSIYLLFPLLWNDHAQCKRVLIAMAALSYLMCWTSDGSVAYCQEVTHCHWGQEPTLYLLNQGSVNLAEWYFFPIL